MKIRMRRLCICLAIPLVLIALFILPAQTAETQQRVDPFQEIWNAVNDIRSEIDDLVDKVSNVELTILLVISKSRMTLSSADTTYSTL